MDDKKTPVIKIRGEGGFSIAIFADNKKRDNGTEYVSYSAVLQKSWKDKNDQWQQQSVSMFDNNIASVALLLQKAACSLMDVRNGTAVVPQQPAPTAEKTNEQVLDELSNDNIPF